MDMPSSLRGGMNGGGGPWGGPCCPGTPAGGPNGGTPGGPKSGPRPGGLPGLLKNPSKGSCAWYLSSGIFITTLFGTCTILYIWRRKEVGHYYVN